MSYRIELAQSKYLSELPGISRAAAELFPIEDLPLALRSETNSLEIFEEALSKQKLWIAVDENKDEAVGFAFLSEKCGQIHLREISVHPEHGRQGLGTNLLKNVITWANNQKYNQLTLTTFSHLRWNAPFYTKLGFKVVEQSELSSCLNKLLDEESKGLDKSKRVLMSLELNAYIHSTGHR